MCSQKIKSNIKIGVMGAGAFGTSLAILYNQFHKVTLFSAFRDHVDSMKKTRENEFLKDVHLSDNIDIKIVSNLKNCTFDYIFWCFPITPSLEILQQIASDIQENTPIIVCAKGITERGTFLLDEFEKILPNNPIGIMSGPNFAIDIANLLFSAADIGFNDIKMAENTAKTLSNQYMHLRPTDDVVGLQIAGAVKNVIAIACGILVAQNAGQNAVSALLTYGLEEMSVIGIALGARKETFYGLSGVGDLMLTSSSETSRNMSFGKRLGSGEQVEEILKTSASVSEGVICVKYLVELSKKLEIKIPICKTVFDIILQKKPSEFVANIFLDKI